MPKRKMTAKRLLAIAKWQMAGSRARRRKGLPSPRMWDGTKIKPMGKNVMLYHRTTSYRARNILKSRKWKTGPYSNNYVYLSHGGITPEEHIRGNSVVSITVPRKKIHHEFDLIKGVSYYMVDKKDLTGLKVRRVR